MKLRFWLLVMDVAVSWWGQGSRIYLWAVGNASNADDWGAAIPPDDGGPW